MKKFALIILSVFLAASCSGKEGNTPDWPWEDPEVVEPGKDDAEEDKWLDVSSQFGTLPDYLKVYRSAEKLEGKPAVAYIAVADMKSAGWDVWSVRSDATYATNDSYMTPSEAYRKFGSPIVINGGFFYHSGGTNYTSSLAVSSSELLAYNINYASEDWVTIYYPTRAAFMQKTDGSFDACWTYYGNGGHFMYPSPAMNSWSGKPKEQPSSSYPKKAETFAAVTAIGGGPVLINDGKFTDSYEAELFNGNSGIGPDTDQPRTAIGVTADSKLIFFVCEGRNMTKGVNGLTTADVANILLDLDCVEAVNLDGGGSSCMLVNGKETIKVSDGSQRAVGSTVMIK